MAEAEKGNTAVPTKGDAKPHDRVAMLSLRSDGTPDQTDPEIIGNEEFARTATREQFAQQAVSAADDAARVADATAAGAAEKVDQDPTIAKRQKEHQALASSAEKAADKVVDALYTGDDEPSK